MDSNYKAYDHLKSYVRIDEILAAPLGNYEEVDSLPDREELTFTNGFYANCTALFIDIRDSSELPSKYNRPALVYNTQYTWGIDEVFGLAATAFSLTKILNCMLKQNGYNTPLRFEIGMSYGRALMIKAGYNGSGINDVVYMGDVVNQAAKLASKGSNGWGVSPIFVDGLVYLNLNEHNQGLLERLDYGSIYHGNVINTVMEEWYKANCI